MHDEVEQRASALMQKEQWESAIALIEQVPETARAASLNWNHGWALFKLERLEEASAALRRCVQQDPDRAVSHWALGVILRERGDRANAEKHLLRALALKDSGMARLNLAILYMKQGRLEDAERVHLAGLKLKPNDRRRVEAYADFLSDCGRESDAQAQYARAMALSEQ